ncbi:MAG: hypothetical protein ACYC5H_12260 [Methylovirgula sp.]
MPGGVAKTFVQTHEPDLKGPFDEWLARIICFAFSVSPQALTAQMNRATAETQKELAEEEGLTPILNWVKSLIDDVIAQEFQSADLEFSWSNEASIDPQTQESILSSYATKGILTINEARVALGREPFAEADANRPMLLTASGYVPLRQQAAGKKRPNSIAKDNPYHDQRGRFTTADLGGTSGHSEGRHKHFETPHDASQVNFTSRPPSVDNHIQPAIISCDALWESDVAICHSALILEDPHYHGLCMMGAVKRFNECLGGLAISPLLPY